MKLKPCQLVNGDDQKYTKKFYNKIINSLILSPGGWGLRL